VALAELLEPEDRLLVDDDDELELELVLEEDWLDVLLLEEDELLVELDWDERLLLDELVELLLDSDEELWLLWLLWLL